MIEGVEALSDAAVESLAQHKGELHLGLTSLSDAAAKHLAKHKGKLSLIYLENLSDAAAESLCERKNVECFAEAFERAKQRRRGKR
jgi:hypothetical protein